MIPCTLLHVGSIHLCIIWVPAARDIHRAASEFLTSLFQKLFAKNNIHPGIGRLYVLPIYFTRITKKEKKSNNLKKYSIKIPETMSRRRRR